MMESSSDFTANVPMRSSRPFSTAEQERWAEALAVLNIHGDAAPVHVATRIGELALAGDQAGIDRWKSIAHRLDQLRQGPSQ